MIIIIIRKLRPDSDESKIKFQTFDQNIKMRTEDWPRGDWWINFYICLKRKLLIGSFWMRHFDFHSDTRAQKKIESGDGAVISTCYDSRPVGRALVNQSLADWVFHRVWSLLGQQRKRERINIFWVQPPSKDFCSELCGQWPSVGPLCIFENVWRTLM